jgi:hypothetical protein
MKTPTPPKVSLRRVRHAAQTHEQALRNLVPVIRSLTERVQRLEQDRDQWQLVTTGHHVATNTFWKRLVWLWKGIA